MKRRLVLARAFLNDPQIIILDEPTTGLDPQARHLIWERLEKLKATGKTFVLTTHYMDEATRLCDELVLMDHGKILEQGKPQDLIYKHIGRETIEVKVSENESQKIMTHLKNFNFTSERTGTRLFLYTNQGPHILEKLIELNDFEFSHRQSTLEDVFLRVWKRNMKVWSKYIKEALIGTVADPLIFLFFLGYGIGQYIGAIDGISYIQYIAPGLWM